MAVLAPKYSDSIRLTCLVLMEIGSRLLGGTFLTYSVGDHAGRKCVDM